MYFVRLHPDVTLVKIPKTEKNYFNCAITDDKNYYRGVCFSPEKQLFTSIEEK